MSKRELNIFRSRLGMAIKSSVFSGKYDHLLTPMIVEGVEPFLRNCFEYDKFSLYTKGITKSAKHMKLQPCIGAYETRILEGYVDNFDELISKYDLYLWVREKIARKLYVRHHYTINISIRCIHINKG